MGQLQGLHASFPGRMRGLGPTASQPGKSRSDGVTSSPCQFLSLEKWFRWCKKAEEAPRILPHELGFILECPHVGLKTLSPNTAPPPHSTVLSPLSQQFSANPGPALTLPTHRGRPCAHNHAREPGGHTQWYSPPRPPHALASVPAEGTAWYRCVHLQRRPGGF